jgi:tetratricopeptide (TPR) repeat protein
VDSRRREEGLELLARAIMRRPRFAWALAWLGEGLRRDGRREEARRALDAAAACDPRCFFARAWSARLALDESDFRRALAHAQAAMRRRPQSALAIGLRGRALLAMGRASAARGDLELASALEPKDAETHRLRDESIRLCDA